MNDYYSCCVCRAYLDLYAVRRDNGLAIAVIVRERPHAIE